jgi:hypothetical protein
MTTEQIEAAKKVLDKHIKADESFTMYETELIIKAMYEFAKPDGSGRAPYPFWPSENNCGQMNKLKAAALPLIEHLNENNHPHVAAIVTQTSVELLEGLMGIPNIYDFVKE